MSNIVITGANQGIGYFLAEQLLKDGNRVAVLDLETGNLEKLKREHGNNLLYYVVDVRNHNCLQNAVQAVAAEFGSIDIAVHNACKCTFDAEANTDLYTYRDVFEVNYFGALGLAKSVLPYMVEQKNGRIIFTSSGVGITGFANISPYASTKGALEALAKCLKIEYAKSNISFHIYHPPLTRTKSSEPLPVPKEFMAAPEKVGQGLAKHIHSNQFIICHNLWQKIQTLGCYLFPIKMGSLLAKMTYSAENKTGNK
ncbi:MAG: SDR family oxidoreductase [Clostridia bacterium]|nr:SDR family oxidoreductase [Clostridia bacterium]